MIPSVFKNYFFKKKEIIGKKSKHILGHIVFLFNIPRMLWILMLIYDTVNDFLSSF